ncbi:MAG: hypothetical protein EB051_00225 [Chlamydiia bacterium]|nr:hypothetical protein [Chlamydiia bacterium]
MECLSNNLFMIPREIPAYLRVAYSLRYKDEPNSGNCPTRIAHVVQRTFSLIKEVITQGGDFKGTLLRNKEKLQRDFEVINQTVSGSQKPLCIYLVSGFDDSGAVLGNHVYYYHHYKIQGLQQHFSVAPKVVCSQDEMKEFMSCTRAQYPGREIKFVDIVTHGSKSSLAIQKDDGQDSITPNILKEDLFADCADDATILLDACITGLGNRNIADEIARKTPGRKILAAGPSMFFSKPVIDLSGNEPRVVSAVHGPAIFYPYECKSFSYAEKRPSQYPYINDWFLHYRLDDNLKLLSSCSILRNPWLDQFVTEDRQDLKKQILTVCGKLHSTTLNIVIRKICESRGGISDIQGRAFLREHTLDPCVRSAFRSAFNELIDEVREYRGFELLKISIAIQNVWEVIQAGFATLTFRQALATARA